MKAVLLIVLILLVMLYVPLNRQAPNHRFKTIFDRQIPLIPWTVWIYFSYYLLFPLSIIIAWNSPYITPFLITQIMATAIASLFWTIVPNGVLRPTVNKNQNLHLRALSLLYSHDRDSNGLPSGHVLHSFVACYFMAKILPQLWPYFFIMLLGISFSTLTTKQHYFLDMVTTLVIAPLIIEVSSIIHL